LPRLSLIVEGRGDVLAAPELASRILSQYHRFGVTFAEPKNAHGVGGLTVPGGVERLVQLAMNEPGSSGIVIICDSDGPCPGGLACGLAERVRAIKPRVPVGVVAAQREYEGWFLASMDSIAGRDLDGRPGVLEGSTCDSPETETDAKGWISRHMRPGRAYKETLDQLAMTRLIDIGVAHARSRSFRHLGKTLIEIVDAMDANALLVIPPRPAALPSPGAVGNAQTDA
jgi:hypothetical protein